MPSASEIESAPMNHAEGAETAAPKKPRRAAPGRMRAAVLAAPRRVEITEKDIPDPGPGQVRVRLAGCGLCGSNLPVYEGRSWFKYPFAAGAPGHEGWGWVEAIGEGVTGWREGDPVAALTWNAFAEYDLAPPERLVRLPEPLVGRPFPGEALGCAMNVMRRSDIQPGQNVAVVGVGFLGALLVALASQAGARVIAIGRRACSLATAARMGASVTIRLDPDLDVVSKVNELTDGAGCDRVIEAAGAQDALDICGPLTRARGRLIIAGYHQDPRRVNMQIWNWRGLDVINAHERETEVYIRGMAEAVDAVTHGKLDPMPLFTHWFGLESLGEAFETALERPAGFMKAWVAL